MQEEKQNMGEKIAKLEAEIKEQVDRNKILEQQDGENKSAVDAVKKEQDDLLVLLSDQEEKLHQYKVKLRELGAEVCF